MMGIIHSWLSCCFSQRFALCSSPWPFSCLPCPPAATPGSSAAPESPQPCPISRPLITLLPLLWTPSLPAQLQPLLYSCLPPLNPLNRSSSEHCVRPREAAPSPLLLDCPPHGSLSHYHMFLCLTAPVADSIHPSTVSPPEELGQKGRSGPQRTTAVKRNTKVKNILWQHQGEEYTVTHLTMKRIIFKLCALEKDLAK